MNQIIRSTVAAGFSLLAFACQPARTAPESKSADVRLYSIGHSLSAEIPDITAALARATPGLSYTFQEQFRLGAALRLQWEEAQTPRDQWDEPQYRLSYPKALPKGNWTAVVLIDSVPRGGPSQEAESVEYLTRFARYIAETNPKARVLFAEGWHSLQSGTGKAAWDTISPTRDLLWRKRLDADAPMWERIRAKAEQTSGRKIEMIPQARALGRLADAIEAGRLPGIASVNDIFADDIHLNPYGMYFLGCLHYAVLYGRSPEGLPFDVKDRWGRAYWDRPVNGGRAWPRPQTGAIREMQRIAWQAASADTQANR